jgi:nucleoside-diphosphate-sugar epimerase
MGASGFLGRHLLDELKDEVRIEGIARRSQARSGAPVHRNIGWYQVDIGERADLAAVFRRIRSEGPVHTVVHLAEYYDFTGDELPEYHRTNVDGLKNTLDLSREIGISRFVFASSVSACELPSPGGALDETSPPDAEHIYGRTKRLGERMLEDYRTAFPSVVVRFAALFSDWCEYPPLFLFLETWLSNAWNRGILGGRGFSAIPYLHVRDGVSFLRTVLENPDRTRSGDVLIASPDGATNHRDLFSIATLNWFGRRRTPLLLPRALCGAGIWARDVAGSLLGERPFERPWMAKCIDRPATIDARKTREKLGWSPRPRLEILRRLPFLIENKKTDPLEWNRLNRAAMKEVHVPANLLLYRLMEEHENEIIGEFSKALLGPKGREKLSSYQRVSADDLDWDQRVVLRNLMNSVRTREKGIVVAYCRELAQRRSSQGFRAHELCGALELLNLTCFRVLRRDPRTKGLRQLMLDHITMNLRFGCDQAQEVFDGYQAAEERRERREALPGIF